MVKKDHSVVNVSHKGRIKRSQWVLHLFITCRLLVEATHRELSITLIKSLVYEE